MCQYLCMASSSGTSIVGERQCRNKCGWSAFRTFETCCWHCKPGGKGTHARDCASKNKKFPAHVDGDSAPTDRSTALFAEDNETQLTRQQGASGESVSLLSPLIQHGEHARQSAESASSLAAGSNAEDALCPSVSSSPLRPVSCPDARASMSTVASIFRPKRKLDDDSTSRSLTPAQRERMARQHAAAREKRALLSQAQASVVTSGTTQPGGSSPSPATPPAGPAAANTPQLWASFTCGAAELSFSLADSSGQGEDREYLVRITAGPRFQQLLAAVRSLPERRWDGAQRAWIVPWRMVRELAPMLPVDMRSTPKLMSVVELAATSAPALPTSWLGHGHTTASGSAWPMSSVDHREYGMGGGDGTGPAPYQSFSDFGRSLELLQLRHSHMSGRRFAEELTGMLARFVATRERIGSAHGTPRRSAYDPSDAASAGRANAEAEPDSGSDSDLEIVQELSADEELTRQFEEAKRAGRYIEIDDGPDDAADRERAPTPTAAVKRESCEQSTSDLLLVAVAGSGTSSSSPILIL